MTTMVWVTEVNADGTVHHLPYADVYSDERDWKPHFFDSYPLGWGHVQKWWFEGQLKEE